MPESGLEILGKRPGNWKVLLSPKALKSIQSMGRSGNFGPIEEKLRDLASGLWTYRLAGTEKQRKKLRIPLATMQCNSQTLILWQVDVAFDDTTQVESQLVKVWEIGTRAETSPSIDRIILLQRSYSTEHVTRCRRKPLEDGDKNLVPIRFTGSQDAVEPGARADALDIRTADREVLEMTNRFYTLTEPMLRSVLSKDLLAEFPFDFSGDETRIILHFGTSSLILGRSGTGKTTCLVFKLLAKYAAGSSVTRERLPKQLLLTRSTELANKLKDYINRLMRTLTASSADEGEHEERELSLQGVDEDEDRLDTIFELQDGSFPLICTFDRFLELLENTISSVELDGFPTTNDDGDAQEDERSEWPDPLEAGYPRWHSSGRDKGSLFVDLQSFKLDYWPRFPATLTAKVSVELIFAEIMGVIKGSLSSRRTLKPLSRNEYLQLSSRLAPAFTVQSEKSRVYDLFEKYQALKLHRCESDGVDRVVKAIRAIRDNQRLKQCLGASFDEIYIDEVQDLRCLEIELLLSIVKDGRAFHFAGDTAQTISQDSHFRFQDIKALFYDHFVTEASLANQPGLARPQLFTLSKNYRSHQGILGLASLVMEMLWTSFPETVDKLEPEIGQIHGPIPVFLLGCDAQLLASSDTGSADRPKQSLDFGAEQAIIVRDPNTKAKLQTELGDKALVLTILQSKGMEFEDVFLWNFFTDSSCPGSWRHLKTKPEDFDAKSHAGLCSELKHLYVAITRARIRLSIIESDESLAAQIAEFLNEKASSPLVEVTKSSDPNFLRELVSLRSVSYNPGKWSDRGQELMQRRQYEDAVICFRRAKDERGEAHANAWLDEENGRRQASLVNTELAISYFRAAADKFMELDLTVDVVRNLERMGKFEEAAELWCRKKRYGKAAPFYEKAGLFETAANCYHTALLYDKAADALRRGDLGDQLVEYITENQQHLSSNCFGRLSRFCVLLLKQERLLSTTLVQAIKLLGSPKEQERAFIDYGMGKQLKNLYIEQRNVKKLFFLHFKAGELAEALKALDDIAWPDSDDFPAPVVQRAYDYFFAGVIVCPKDNDCNVSDIAPRPPSSLPEAAVIQRTPEWIIAHRIVAQGQKLPMYGEFERMKDGLVRSFLEIHHLLDSALFGDIRGLREVPFQALQAALDLAKVLTSSTESCPNPLALLLTGVLEIDRRANHYILLSWSPLRKAAPTVRAEEYPRIATQWLLERIAYTILAFDAKLRDLWKMEWPVRCVNYLTLGSCRKRRDDACSFFHERLSAADCTAIISLLVKINTIFCTSSILHYRRVMGERFQESFLGMRRHWLENLVQELTFISSVERCSSVIVRVQSDLLAENPSRGAQRSSLTVASHIESLLFHRLGREWSERNDLSSLFEQIQLSQIFDSPVQARFNRALFYMLRRARDTEFQWHMVQGLKSLEGEIDNPNAASFSTNLRNFAAGVKSADIKHLASFHALTTVFEFFALYLMFRICRTGLIMPQSWIDIHLPRFFGIRQSHSSMVLADTNIHIYRRSLVGLTRDFVGIISKLDPSASFNVMNGFRLGIRIYPSRLLHRRNVELLSIAIINLWATGVDVPSVTGAWTEVSKAFRTRFLGAEYLQHNTVPELLERLVKSYSIYYGKDTIKLVKTAAGYHYFEGMLQKLGVQALALESIFSTISELRKPRQAQPTVGAAEDYDESYIRAVRKIQRFWRQMCPKIQRERNLMKTAKGRWIVQFRTICKQLSVSEGMLDLLSSRGFELHERHRIQSAKADESKQRALDLACTLPQDQFETVNDVINRVHDSEQELDTVAAKISVDGLQELARGELTEVEGAFRMIESVLQKVEGDMQEVKHLLGTIRYPDQV